MPPPDYDRVALSLAFASLQESPEISHISQEDYWKINEVCRLHGPAMSAVFQGLSRQTFRALCREAAGKGIKPDQDNVKDKIWFVANVFFAIYTLRPVLRYTRHQIVRQAIPLHTQVLVSKMNSHCRHQWLRFIAFAYSFFWTAVSSSREFSLYGLRQVWNIVIYLILRIVTLFSNVVGWVSSSCGQIKNFTLFDKAADFYRMLHPSYSSTGLLPVWRDPHGCQVQSLKDS